MVLFQRDNLHTDVMDKIEQARYEASEAMAKVQQKSGKQKSQLIVILTENLKVSVKMDIILELPFLTFTILT